VGMMAVFGGISRAPLAVLIMVTEMTGNIQIVAPALVAVALSSFVVSRNDDSIYRSQLRTRADSEASRLQFGLPLLNLVPVSSAAVPPRLVLRDHTALEEAVEELRSAGVPGAPVVDEDALYLGTVELARVVRLLEQSGLAESGGAGAGSEADGEGARGDGEGAARREEAPRHLTLAAAVDTTTPTVPDTARLNVALDALMQAGGHWVTVTTARRVVGVLSITDLVRAYQRALATNAGQIASVSSGAVTIEERVGTDSPVAGVPLSAAGLPPGCIVVSVQRGEHMLFATGSTTLRHGDLVSALANPTTAEAARRMLRGTDEPKPPLVERGGQLV
ncbi:MAG TPA: TrkA C-terminal domain-containing protein, partial [Acidimicrobiales bacterium]|nr:TrkA C-terminal domain-containing protein [Acidimicrobiales bacterium]